MTIEFDQTAKFAEYADPSVLVSTEWLASNLNREGLVVVESDEDVHSALERGLTEKIGAIGGAIRAGRSRNDQVATDIRLWLRSEIDLILVDLARLREAFLNLAEQHANTIMPGHTHLQVAQPITFGHHLMAYFEMFSRDASRLADCRKRMNRLPLGAAALAGTSYPIDREWVAQKLGFERMSFLNVSVAESTGADELPARIDVVTALHACDTATDDAIAFGLQKQARAMVLVPCCQAEMAACLRQGKALQLSRTPLAELWRHPLHTRELGSQVTNVLRCLYLEASGYQVTVTELVGWEHSMKNELIIARYTGQKKRSASERLRAILEEFGLDKALGARFGLKPEARDTQVAVELVQD